jgi:hypothetical protein
VEKERIQGYKQVTQRQIERQTSNEPTKTDDKSHDRLTMAQVTTEIINEFVEQIDNDKVYDLKELKQILSDIYKTKTAKPKKAAKKPKAEQSSDDEEKPKKKGKSSKAPKLDKDGNEKPKRAPSAYNNYMKIRIKALIQEQPGTIAQELLKIAAGEWKLLSDEDKAKYKTVV